MGMCIMLMLEGGGEVLVVNQLYMRRTIISVRNNRVDGYT